MVRHNTNPSCSLPPRESIAGPPRARTPTTPAAYRLVAAGCHVVARAGSWKDKDSTSALSSSPMAAMMIRLRKTHTESVPFLRILIYYRTLPYPQTSPHRIVALQIPRPRQPRQTRPSVQ